MILQEKKKRGRKPTFRTVALLLRVTPESYAFMQDLGVNKSEFVDCLVRDYKKVFESRQLKFVDL